MTKQTFIVLALIVGIPVGLVTFALFQKPLKRPNMTVTFMGYTNDTSGTRLASFAVSNAGPSTVQRTSHYWIQIPTAKRWTNLSDGWLVGSVLAPGSSETVVIPAATNQSSWRVSFYVSAEVGLMRDVMRSTAQLARDAGLRPRYRPVNYGVQSEWIEAAPANEFEWEMVSRKDFPAPDGRHVATVFEMCCYCTTGDFPQLTLRKPEEKIGDVGNVLSLGPMGEIKVQWLSSTNLAVEYHYWEERKLPATTNVNGVTITFKGVRPQDQP